ncbi:SOS response-associated peptidase family protein [uncultured Enorma sp.]|uniref:SOS response-associated peptidase family protein n=1 Tax=uncultured Enorma sp. TaxID=1714346 RepID=UPI0025925D1A|nr:SOS response-associated peptidase family protein [uncultured Enorma sp.]
MRMCALTADEAQEVLDARLTPGSHALDEVDDFADVADAYPGSTVAAYERAEDGALVTVSLTWGFALKDKPHAVFNTRLETALQQAREGRGMWSSAILQGRCLVPVRAFYETHGSERVKSEHTGKMVRRQYRFRLPGARAFLLAGIYEDGCLSIVTVDPNASVAPVHNRMPLVLGPGESSVWLGPDFERLANRDGVDLQAEPER